MEKVDVIIIGAGAAGLMCALTAGARTRRVLVLEKSNKAGKKILMSGGGRCNFTNLYINPNDFISHTKRFCHSALSRYTQWDFIELVKKHKIPFHEKMLGQLFCDNKSKDILEMLLNECAAANVAIRLNTEITAIEKLSDSGFKIKSTAGEFQCESLVIATGGLSIPTLGSSPFGYQIAEQFGIKVWQTRAGLVPLTLHDHDKERYAQLSGVSVDSHVTFKNIAFRENILFTHRGLSGPAILQISSYWQPGENLQINLLPSQDLVNYLKIAHTEQPQKLLKNVFAELLPKQLVEIFLNKTLAEKKMATISYADLMSIAKTFQAWQIKPNGTEGYRTAEVTLGGVDCAAISSKTFEVQDVRGLYFIGEVLDVTGWLGGFNFQWAWSSGWAAGQVV